MKRIKGILACIIAVTMLSGCSLTINVQDGGKDGKVVVTENDSEGFWGIWCYASKDEKVAEDKVEKLRDGGFDAHVIKTSDWSNLDGDGYYAVCAGMYKSEEAAKEVLSKAVSAGYEDAYVKHSGEKR